MYTNYIRGFLLTLFFLPLRFASLYRVETSSTVSVYRKLSVKNERLVYRYQIQVQNYTFINSLTVQTKSQFSILKKQKLTNPT